MTGQIVEITCPGYWLHKSRGFLEVCSKGDTIGRVALDDIASVIISVPGCALSSILIAQLSQRNIPLVICGSNYLPSSITLQLDGYGRQFQVMQAQTKLSQPRRKRMWQQVVRAKINNQAVVLERVGKNNKSLLRLVDQVRSGDPSNCEAQAARKYWRLLFGEEFRRDRNAAGLNVALNYVYTIVRACVARGVSGAGLHPSFSLHHKNPQNPFNLVDDLVEPYRPIADYLLFQNMSLVSDELSREMKTKLAAITSLAVPLQQEISPLSLSAVRMCRALAAYYLSAEEDVPFPTVPSLLDYSSMGNGE